jgi:hypothetical protein
MGHRTAESPGRVTPSGDNLHPQPSSVDGAIAEHALAAFSDAPCSKQADCGVNEIIELDPRSSEALTFGGTVESDTVCRQNLEPLLLSRDGLLRVPESKARQYRVRTMARVTTPAAAPW